MNQTSSSFRTRIITPVDKGSRQGTASFLLGLITTSILTTNALAVTVPGSVDPGQVERRFTPSPEVPSLDTGLPLPTPVERLSKSQRAAMEKKLFTLKEVVISGATIYTHDELSFAFANKIGKTISLLDAQLIAKQITDFYHKNGYVLTQAVVPEQDVSKGVLRIRVVEGFISHVEIQGVKSDTERAIIASYGDKIMAIRPTSTQEIERYMLLMNDLAGVTARGLLKPSATDFGGADLVLTIQKKSFDGQYTLDNRGTKLIGPWQHTATLGANSLLGYYDRTQLQVLEASSNLELLGFELQHEELLDSEGTKVNLLASHTHTEPGDRVKVLGIVGDSDFYQVKVSHPFLRSRQENLVGRVILDARDTNTDIFDNVYFSDDRLRVARIGGNFSLSDGWLGTNVIDTQVSQGLNIFNASESGADRSNAIGDSGFTKINLDVSRVQTLPYQFSILAAASGQYSFDPLLVAEQFSIGGPDYGQAYDPSELLGDSGVAAKIELRYTDVIEQTYMHDYQLFTNYDIGQTWLRGVSSAVNDKSAISSVNAGVRVNFNENLSANLQGGIPLTKPVTNEGNNDPRVFVGLVARF